MKGPEQQASAPPPTEVTRPAFTAAIWGQCFGVQPQVALGRGLGLLYLHALGIPPDRIAVLLSLSLLVRGLLSIPAGYWADRLGRKRLGIAGQWLAIAGFVGLAVAAWVPQGLPVLATVTVGMVTFGLGTTLFGAGWFALLSPLIPADARGRHLGRLRFARQLAAVVFGGLIALWMSETTPLAGFQMVFAGLTVCLVIRLVFYRRIPELERSVPARAGLAESLAAVLAIPGYRRFCIFVLAIFVLVGAVPMLFGLLELEELNLGDAVVWQLGVVMIAGHMVGSRVAGHLVDALGGRLMLGLCQLAFLVSLALLVSRGGGLSILMGAVLASFLFGVAKTALEIAVHSELLGLAPRENKALAVSACTTLIYLGESLAGLLIAGLLGSAALAQWSSGGGSSRYDVVLIGLGFGLVALLTTTALVTLANRHQVAGRSSSSVD